MENNLECVMMTKYVFAVVLLTNRVSALGIPIIGIPREKWDFTFPISQGKILKIPWEKFHFLKSHLV